MATNDDIADALTSHQIGLQRLSNGLVRRILELLNRSDARIVERLARTDISQLSRSRQEALLQDIRRIIESVYTDATGQLVIELEDLALYERDYQRDLFQRIIPVDLNTIRPSADQIIAAVTDRPFQGRIMKDWFAELERGAFERLRNTITAGIVEGRTTGQIVREVRGSAAQGYKDGVISINKRHAETTVRTATNHTANAARAVLYERNMNLIKGVQWLSTLDGRTSAVCRARDGKVYKPEKGPRPPAHPNCRSTTTPVLKSWKELGLSGLPPGTRASMNGQVAADQTYDDWLRKQPTAFQNDVLGKKKASMFRRGLKLDRFVNRAGDEYTLDQLRQREAEYWADKAK